MTSNETAFCLLTKEPCTVWLDFLSSFPKSYKMFIAIDNQKSYSYLKAKYPNVTFIQVADEECIKDSYVNSDYFFKKIVATDRAFHYFNRSSVKYENIWFCEDDVFFEDSSLIVDLDESFPFSDLIAPGIELNEDGRPDGWVHWHDVAGTLKLPWARFLICLVRVSPLLMKKVDEFVAIHKKLIFKEILFHSLALHNNMRIDVPEQLKKIRWPDEWGDYEILYDRRGGMCYAYHPFKGTSKHALVRNNPD